MRFSIKKQVPFVCKNAFTLTEVLLTILIVGSVAVMTLPGLIQKNNERTTIKKVQKAYSVLSNTYLLAINEFGYPSDWGCSPRSIEASVNCRDKLFQGLKGGVKCEDKTSQKNCGLPSKRAYLDRGYAACTSSNSASIQTNDGIVFMICSNDISYVNKTSNIAWINIDINGENKPNKYGYDEFSFMLTDRGIIPHDYYSTGCTSDIIKNKNMQYLKDKKCSNKL